MPAKTFSKTLKHALKTTSFAYGTPSLAQEEDGSWIANVRVTNSDHKSGAEPVQAYIELPDSDESIGDKQPLKRLVGIGRIELTPDASGDVAIVIDPVASNHPLNDWDEEAHEWAIPSGEFTVWVGRSSSLADLVKAGTIAQ